MPKSRPEPIVNALCSRCGRPIAVEKWIYDLAMSWNENRGHRRNEKLTENELVLCDGCKEALSQPAHEQQGLFGKKS